MSDEPSIRILIADDHEVVRIGLSALLDRQAGFRVVGQAASGQEAIRLARTLRPDVVVMDIRMPDGSGTDACRVMTAEAPETPVVMLTSYADEEALFDAISAGASGYVLKREADQEIVDAARAVVRGEAFLTNAAERSLIRDWMSSDEEGPREPLTPRGQEVVKLIAEAHTNAQIAEILHLSEKTVESHRANLLRKLGMRDRVELVRYAIRRGLTEA